MVVKNSKQIIVKENSVVRKRGRRIQLRISIASFFLILVVGVIILAFIVFILPWLMIAIGFWFWPSIPMPEIRNAEFPFRVEYYLDGELMVVEDTLIVEHGGTGVNAGIGRYHRWNSRLASDPTRGSLVLLKLSDNHELYITTGNPAFLMGDTTRSIQAQEHGGGRVISFTVTYPIVSGQERRSTSSRVLSEEELYDTYGIKLISFELAKPIINTFQ